MKTHLLAVASCVLSLSCLAAPIFSSTSAPAPDAPGAEAASALFKLAPGCEFSVEIGDQYNRLTDAKGRSVLMTFFPDGRVASVETDKTQLVVVYDSATGKARYISNPASGQAFPLESGKGAGWYKSLRAEGKLPSLEKLVARVCSSSGAKTDPIGDGDLLQDMTNPTYWEDMFWGDYAFSLDSFDQLQDCEAQKAACKDHCDQVADTATISCGGYGLVISMMGGPEIGALAGLICAGAALNDKWTCRANCDAHC